MEYKRLTEKGKNGEWTVFVNNDGRLSEDIQTIIDRLAELEDKIEQGYIKILPVKEGDKIYVVPSKVNFDLNKLNGYSKHNRVYEQTVDEIRFFRKDIYMVFSCDYLENHRGASLGETWFLTREEAEKRLKELQK